MLRFDSTASAAIAVLCLAAPASGAVLSATPATLAAVFASAAAGDTIRLANGSYGATGLSNRSFITPVTIDATLARFTGLLTIANVDGLVLRGGSYTLPGPVRYAKAITVSGGANISVLGPQISGFAGTQGVYVQGTRSVMVNDGRFVGLKVGIGLKSVTGGVLLRNTFTAQTSDGINIADSHSVRASFNRCQGTVIEADAHPDCIQLWSVLGYAPQSDIELSDNTAEGATQGFTSFNASDGGGDRIVMVRNRVNTSYPQGIACYNCRDSVLTDNVLTTLPDSAHQTTINIVGGARNIVERNSIGPRQAERLAD